MHLNSYSFPISIIIIYAIVIFLIPIFQFVGFVGDGFNEIQNIFQEMEKHIEEFEWEKKSSIIT